MYDAMYKKYKDAIRCNIFNNSLIVYNTGKDVVIEKFGFKIFRSKYALKHYYHNNGMLFYVDTYLDGTRIRVTHSNFSEFYLLVKFLKSKFNVSKTLELCNYVNIYSNEQEIFDALVGLGYKRSGLKFKSSNGLNLVYSSQRLFVA